MKWIRRIGALLGLLLLAAVVAAFVYSRQALPRTEGEARLPGLRGELKIERDADGIPTIRAGNLHDLMFGLGVAHAQDRLWQLETHRRIGAGRLSEAFGPGALDNDRFLRALGVRRAAQAQWEHVQGESREALQGYAAGVNAAVQHLGQALPPEFLVLGVKPEDWSPVDSLAWSIMMAWDLGGNWSTELLRLRLALKLDKPRIDQLLPPYPGEQPVATQDYTTTYRGLKLAGTVAGSDAAAAALLAAAPESGIEGVGSNNWVLAGSRTTTGKPLLANDPHLKLSAPALWYFARLDAPGYRVAGATLPGVPGVVLGQNEHVAWGYTNTGPDVQDLYLERVKPDDAEQYQTPDGWARFDRWQETIAVRGQAPVTLTVRATRHGPVISDAGVADDVVGAPGRQGYVLAMRWTALDAEPGLDQLGATLRMNRAASVAEFIEAARGWVAPMQNMVVADAKGHIGYIAPGRVPMRRAEHDLRGLSPAPGWDARYDWAGWLPFDALPQQRDPQRGYIATANQRIVAPDYPHYLTSSWALPFRQQRIEQMLDAKPRHSLADLQVQHADVRSLGAGPTLAWLQRVRSDHPLAAAATKQLQGFDGTMAADHAAPLIYWAWLRRLTMALLSDELGPLFERTFGGRSYFEAVDAILARNDAWWCDDKRTPAVETCAQQSDAALRAALDELQAAQGSDPAAWRWGRAHVSRAEHRPFSHVKALAPYFELRAPVGGDTFTVNVSRVNLKADRSTGELYLDEHGPSLRAVYDLADRANSGFMHSTGQSGIPWSPHYSRFLQSWVDVRYVPVWPREPAAQMLTLRPLGAP
jgi:penicillin amidase